MFRTVTPQRRNTADGQELGTKGWGAPASWARGACGEDASEPVKGSGITALCVLNATQLLAVKELISRSVHFS